MERDARSAADMPGAIAGGHRARYAHTLPLLVTGWVAVESLGF